MPESKHEANFACLELLHFSLAVQEFVRAILAIEAAEDATHSSPRD
jgi:hypothetical protein